MTEYSETIPSLREKKKRGRPRIINEDDVMAALTKFKERLSPNGDGLIVSKNDNVWEEISTAIKHVKSADALYTYVVCDQDHVRRRLWNNFIPGNSVVDDNVLDISKSLVANSTLHSTIDDDPAFSFTIHIPASQFNQLVETRVVILGKKQRRNVKKFRKGEWQEFITQKIWKSTRSKCAYNFHHHHLNVDCTSGNIGGRCRCGSEISCIIERNEDDIVTIHCSTTAPTGEQECGKRYVRGSTRAELGEKLQTKSAHVLRCEMANDIMNEGDPVPPHLPSTDVLRKIKSQAAASRYLHPDPIAALELLSLHEMKEEIPFVGHIPFFIHYSTKHQRTIYTTASEEQHVSLSIDATGSIIAPITRQDKSKSGPIFLYVAVLVTPAGPLSVAQMLSERQTTGTIHFWLTQWISQWGLRPPNEIICDASIALLSAAVRAFTTQATVNEYADEFFTNDLPACYIRIDVAHFIKTWANLMRDLRAEIGTFYKVGIGKLIVCRNIKEAEQIVRALLTIARSRNSGDTKNGRVSACDKQKAYMMKLITTNMMEELDLDDEWTEESLEETDKDCLAMPDRSRAEPSKWRKWGQEIDASVLSEIKHRPGTEPNAHWLPMFADRLIEKLKWLPLWSCIIRDKYGYGRCPASSAHVEAEFRIIKTLLLKDKNPPLRPDVFIQTHKTYIDGLCKLDEAALAEERQRGRRNKNQHRDDSSYREEEVRPDDTDCTLDSEIDDPMLHSSPIIKKLPPMIECSTSTNCPDVSDSVINSPCVASARSKPRCPACKNGHSPGGAHRCIICNRAVHIFDTCSRPVEHTEEGYGEKRMCIDCSENAEAPQQIKTRRNEHAYNQSAKNNKKWSRVTLSSIVGSRTTNRQEQESRAEEIGIKQSHDENGNIPIIAAPKNNMTKEKKNNQKNVACRISSKSKKISNVHIKNAPFKTDCPACKNQDLPSGAHRCIICSRAVHIFDTCSAPIDNSDEGYGQKRICFTCIKKPNAAELIESRAYENWHNLPTLFQAKQTRSTRRNVKGSQNTTRGDERSRVKSLDDNKSRDENGNKAMEGATENSTILEKDENNNCQFEISSGTADSEACGNCDIIEGAPRFMVGPLDCCSSPAEGAEAELENCKDSNDNDNKKKYMEAPSSTDAKNNTDARPRGKYLQETYAAHNFLLTGELSSVPILKSGIKTELNPIRKGGERIDLINTCAFDSAFQLMLTMTFDSPTFFKNTIKQNVDINRFVRMIHDVHNKNVTAATYRMRSEILCDHFEKMGHPELKCILVDCNTTVAGIYRKLMTTLPCFEERSVCTAKCLPLVKRFPLLTITLQALTASSHNASIEAEIALVRDNDDETDKKMNKCSSEDCAGDLITNLSITGDFAVFEVMSNRDTDKVRLKEIPQTLKLSFMAEEFHLRGIVHFDPPRGLRKSSRATGYNDPLGHYTAFCLRQRRWVQFKETMRTRSANCSVSPQLIIYSK